MKDLHARSAEEKNGRAKTRKEKAKQLCDVGLFFVFEIYCSKKHKEKRRKMKKIT